MSDNSVMEEFSKFATDCGLFLERSSSCIGIIDERNCCDIFDGPGVFIVDSKVVP